MLSIKEYLTTLYRHDFRPPAEFRGVATVNKVAVMRSIIPTFQGWTCRFCERVSGLDDWQIIDMPVEMARCSKSDIPITFRQKFTNSVNCLGKLPVKEREDGGEACL
jgi:hypothetical protein